MEGFDEGFFNKLFWVFFILTAILIALGMASRVYLLDVLLGIMLIALGLNKLEAEMRHDRHERDKQDLHAKVRNMDSMLSDTHSALRDTRSGYDFRLHHLDSKRAEQEGRIEANYRDLAKKMMELENKMNVIAKAIRDAPQLLSVMPRSGRSGESRVVTAAEIAKRAKAKRK